jgi:medium-chain acyl-[acyl-carrier-protein] hydrolase
MSNNKGNLNKWILQKPTIVQTPSKMRLFCFPPAGSGSWVFMEWSKHLPASVEVGYHQWITDQTLLSRLSFPSLLTPNLSLSQVCPVELPGRNTRMGEQPYHSMDDLVKNAVDALSPILLSDTSKPYSLFGHSLGAWMAFEISREIARRGNLPLPLRLYASANRAPSLGTTVNPLDCEETRGAKLADMPEKEFWRHWELRYGEHQAVKTGDPFFSNMFYKLLQADIKMAETYKAEEDACAPCPIVSMMAADESR